MTKPASIILFTLILGLPFHLSCQIAEDDNLLFLDEMPEEVLDDLRDQDGIMEHLRALTEHPVDLNQATERELQELYFLSPIEIKAILDHRRISGSFLDIHELQVIEGLTEEKARALLPFVTVSPPGSSLTDHAPGKGYLLMRSTGHIPLRMGYQSANDHPPAYQGSPLSLLIRYRQSRIRDYSYGINMKKDAGERFTFEDRHGFDSYNIHYYRTNRPGRIKTLALGDYRINMGQGLLLHHGFAITKSANPLLVKRVAPVIQPYSGTSEFYFFRGAAFEFEWNPRLKSFGFFHHKKRDGTLRSYPDGNPYFSAFQTSGLHRTAPEIEKRHNLKESIAGHRLEWNNHLSRLGFNTVYQRFSLPYQPVERLDNLHRITGQHILSHSLDFSGYMGSFHFFGEIATQNYRTPAFTVTGLYSLHPKLEGGILLRRFPAYFAPMYGNTFSARTLPNNESGIYTGLNFYFNPRSRLSFYIDSWKGLWPTFQAHGPTFDQDVFLQYDISKRRHWEAYARFKFKNRAENYRPDGIPYNQIAYQSQSSLRLQFRKEKYQKWRWTNRIEGNRIRTREGARETGWMVFTDFMYRPLGSSWSIAGRLARFHTDSYATRIYALEPDILYSFNVPALYGSGWRLALKAGKKWRNGLRIEVRTGWTILPGAEEIGSGHNAVPGEYSQEAKLQVMYTF